MRWLCLCSWVFLFSCGAPPPLVQSDELPAGLGSFSAAIPWRIYPGAPQTDDARYFEVYQGGDRRNEVGHIAIVRYPSASDLAAARTAILAQVEGAAESASGIGEWAMSTTTDVVFTRCGAVAHVSLPVDALTYAHALDRRLTDAFCR